MRSGLTPEFAGVVARTRVPPSAAEVTWTVVAPLTTSSSALACYPRGAVATCGAGRDALASPAVDGPPPQPDTTPLLTKAAAPTASHAVNRAPDRSIPGDCPAVRCSHLHARTDVFRHGCPMGPDRTGRAGRGGRGGRGGQRLPGVGAHVGVGVVEGGAQRGRGLRPGGPRGERDGRGPARRRG